MGTQWVGMAREMMSFKAFRCSIENSALVTNSFGFDLVQLLTNGTQEDMDAHMSISLIAMGVSNFEFTAYKTKP